MSDDSDWLAGSDDEATNSIKPRSESYDIKKLESTHRKRGYRDGISSAKEENLQHGFDIKFPQGSSLGFKVGEILGSLHLLSSFFTDDKELRHDFEQAKVDLHISNILSEANFNNEMELKSETPPSIEKWNSILAKYNLKYLN
ncbi:HFL280Wp [Eremothecium sinecaudum]|uniref:Protein YAE1 n=1 Tax=Eremothecium sinecaudum TaxID=45286 RepID=A0A0X8HUA3_9SACH|nr:HFL280Wp [Eremothecium sinecaudum]AMD21576.1 HFL280Wp [Eremothecium sinecaudum]